MIGSYAGGLVHGMRVAPLEQDVLFRTDDKECRAECEHKQACEIEIATIHDVKCAGFRDELIQDLDVAGFAIRYADKRRNIAVQVEQRMAFSRLLCGAETSPRETVKNRGQSWSNPVRTSFG